MKPGEWVTQQGATRSIHGLDDAHLGNILRLLTRNACAAKAAKLKFYFDTDPPGGDGASMEFDDEQYALMQSSWREHVDDKFKEIEAECKKRKLPILDVIDEFGKSIDDIILTGQLNEMLKKELEGR